MPPEGHINLLVTSSKDTEFCNLPDNEIIIVVLRKLNGLQKNRMAIQQIRKTIHKQNEIKKR